ncbi:MAG: hypothetical protein AB2L14_25725 [Candidatus Xenobiia bacterium LiM19]
MTGIIRKNSALIFTLITLVILAGFTPIMAQEIPAASTDAAGNQAHNAALTHDPVRSIEFRASAGEQTASSGQQDMSAQQTMESAVQSADQGIPVPAPETAGDSQNTTQMAQAQDSPKTAQDNSSTAQQGKETTTDTKIAAAQPDDFKKFKVLLIPYVWFATTSTDLKVRDRTANAVITPGEAAKYLDGAIAGRIEASQGHIGGFIDINALRLADTVTPNYRNVNMSFTSGVNNYALFYRFKGRPVFDIYAGARTYDFSTDLTIEPGRILNGRKISRGKNWTDFIIGARMNAPLSKNIGIIVSGDVGGLSGNANSWQVEGLVEWKLSQSFSVQGGYKSLHFENTYNGNFIDDISVKSNMYGPIVKFQFSF